MVSQRKLDNDMQLYKMRIHMDEILLGRTIIEVSHDNLEILEREECLPRKQILHILHILSFQPSIDLYSHLLVASVDRSNNRSLSIEPDADHGKEGVGVLIQL